MKTDMEILLESLRSTANQGIQCSTFILHALADEIERRIELEQELEEENHQQSVEDAFGPLGQG